MICRPALSRGSQLALRRQGAAKLAQRGYAAVASPKASYEPTTIAGVKVAARDDNGPTTRLAVVAKAGTRYEPLPGLTNTQKRSALRINRETELLGGQLNAYHTREALVLQANFLREDLPYFTELLAEVLSQTRYTTHEYHEEVVNVIHQKQAKLDAAAIALDAAHSVAFHNGLGAPLYPTPNTPIASYLDENSVAAFADATFTKDTIAVVADGASETGLSKWIEPFFKAVPAQPSTALPAAASKYYGGEQRIAKTSGNSMVLAFPGAALGANQPETAVLVGLLGGESTIKWSPGFSLLSNAAAAAPGATANAANFAYSDAGLLTIQINGSAAAVRKAAEESVKALRSVAEGGVSQENLVKAIAKAKFNLLSGSEVSGTGIVHAGANLIHGSKPLQVAETIKALEGVNADKLKAAAKTLLEGKASVASVGDLHVLPFAEDLGLKLPLSTKQNRYFAAPLPPLALTTGSVARPGFGRERKADIDRALKSRDAELRGASRLGEPFLDRNGSIFKQTQQPSPSCQTAKMTFAWKAAGITYNRYLAVAARVVRRSLKDDKRLVAERRGQQELRFAKWTNGKQGELKNLAEANAEASVESAATGGTH
ncbi:Metalloenzyme, LuxS/M16 peptidase-like protein [Chaetomium sp. MPI-CAGE-AT-0009]|nr:Metalloenzyme, LuxS/M16 peptidase-like protein [Chaetomium sp. MPI-CAGE-AT-0009]